MAFGFPAYHTEHYSPGTTTSELRTAVRDALTSLSWSVREETSGRIIASTHINIDSWGERVLINFLPDDCISVTSKCVFPIQCWDSGRNKANVSKFIMELRRRERKGDILNL